jgi:hypothetical protein
MNVFKPKTEAEKTALREGVELRRRARQLARGGSTGNIHERAIRGLAVYAARLSAAGDPKGGAAILKSADEAQALMDACNALKTENETPREDHIGTAIDAAASELTKRLPACFSTKADAVAFASHLPLIEARRAASLACDAGAKLSRRASEKRHEAQAVIEQACLAAMGGFDPATAMRDVAALA